MQNIDITVQITFQYDNIRYKNDDIKCTYQQAMASMRVAVAGTPLVPRATELDQRGGAWPSTQSRKQRPGSAPDRKNCGGSENARTYDARLL